jgi:hypothetical protein
MSGKWEDTSLVLWRGLHGVLEDVRVAYVRPVDERLMDSHLAQVTDDLEVSTR